VSKSYFELRYRLAYDSRLVRDVLHIFIQEVFSSLRRRAKEQYGIRKAKSGGVTFIQRFGGAINLNIHMHSLVTDGVYYEDENKRIRFQRLPPPADSEVERVTAGIVKKVGRLLERRGLGPQADPEEADPLLREQPLLAELYSASLQGRIASGPGAGERLKGVKFEFEMESEGKKTGRCCANLSGFSLHANVCILDYDVLKCGRCGGRMRILCAINPPAAIKKILDCLGLPSKPPPIFPAVLEPSHDY
jgi:hypothetical protein